MQDTCMLCNILITKYEKKYYEGLCTSCYNKKYYSDNLKRAIKKAIDFSFDDPTTGLNKIICPYCRRTFKDEDGYYFNLGEGEWECPNCGKISDFTTHVDIYYNVTKKEGDN